MTSKVYVALRTCEGDARARLCSLCERQDRRLVATQSAVPDNAATGAIGLRAGVRVAD